MTNTKTQKPTETVAETARISHGDGFFYNDKEVKELNIKERNTVSGNPDAAAPEIPETEVKPKPETAVKEKAAIPYAQIIYYLNKKTGKKFLSSTSATQKCIKARFNQGFTLADFFTVIDNKCQKWLGDPKMMDYLRPETLFGNKFEGYLNESAGFTSPPNKEHEFSAADPLLHLMLILLPLRRGHLDLAKIPACSEDPGLYNVKYPMPETIDAADYLETLRTALARIQDFCDTCPVACFG
jgi:uncharacterized phage protein (TIGR02220 family)